MSTQREKSKNVIIVLLATALILAVGYCLFLSAKSSGHLVTSADTTQMAHVPQFSYNKFVHPVADEDAVHDIVAYRHKKGAHDADVVFYEKSEIDNYFSCIWPSLTKATSLPDGCHWAVGFYFVRKWDSIRNDSVLDFYVIPTIVHPTIDNLNNKPYDFLENYTNTSYYQHDPKYPCAAPAPNALPRTVPDSGNSYDAGQLWP